MIVLTKEQIIFLHTQLIASTGGSDGIRDNGLLESAIASPFQIFDNEEAFPTTLQKAARLCYGLVKNHAFVDGNKRIGAHAMLVFLELNKIELDYTQQDLSETILKVAAGEYGFEDLLRWVIDHQLAK